MGGKRVTEGRFPLGKGEQELRTDALSRISCKIAKIVNERSWEKVFLVELSKLHSFCKDRLGSRKGPHWGRVLFKIGESKITGGW